VNPGRETAPIDSLLTTELTMLHHKVAIVTGSTSGIGLGIARGLAAQGADLVLNGFGQPDEIEFLRAESERRYGVRVRYHGADMSRPDEVRALAQFAQAELGRVDIVVNNAGIQHVAPVETFDEAKWDAVLAINLSSAFHLVKAVIPGMRERRFGRLIHIASAHGLTASPFKSAYVAAKHGLLGLSKTLAVELAEDAITSNTICPGYVKTPLVDKQIADQARAHGISPEQVVRDVMLSHQARKEFVQVEELAALTVFLASDAAASMTGAALAMDGGWTLH
jgi:3-hydroxybutyrate dehydrogenase